MAKPLILIVEDNNVLQKVLQLMCRKLGVDAEIVSDGTQALAAFDSKRTYQVIFMDWRMPDMDGLTFTRLIREREATTGTHVPIVAMTANVDDDDRKTCLAVGMDDYLSKPFTTEEFHRTVSRWLGPEQLAM